MNMVAIFYQYFLTNLVSQLINLSIALYGIIIIVSYFIWKYILKAYYHSDITNNSKASMNL